MGLIDVQADQITKCLPTNAPTTDHRQQPKRPPDTLVKGDPKRQKVYGAETEVSAGATAAQSQKVTSRRQHYSYTRSTVS
jgi:hypothetical protein